MRRAAHGRLSRKRLILLPAMLLVVGVSGPGGSPQGYWLTANNDGVIQIFHCGEALCGKLAWLRLKPDQQDFDLKNPDPTRRSRPLCGLTFMTGFKPTGPRSWEDGRVYDPESGETYHANMTLRPDGMLDLHGYIGISLLGRSEVWTRYTQPLPTCPSR